MPYKDSQAKQAYNKSYNKERYDALKSMGLCCKCGMETAMVGFTICPDCSEKATSDAKIYNDIHKSEATQKKREYRAEHKAKGLCISCTKKRCAESALYCSYHFEKNKQNSRKSYQKRNNTLSMEVIEARGICYRCCKNKAVTDKKWCQACIDEQRIRFMANVMKLGQKKQKEEGWNWRGLSYGKKSN